MTATKKATKETTRCRHLPTIGALVTFITFISILTFLSLQTSSQINPQVYDHPIRNLARSFADTFPDRSLVRDLMILSEDINSVTGDLSASDAISDPKFEVVLWIEAEFSTEVMIIRSREDQDVPPIVVFRGSEELDDWKVNFDFELEESKFENAPEPVEVHKGFQNALFDQNIVGQVEEKILELVGESGEVILTGHSLGGANAHITAVYLADKHPNMMTTMINYGAPRIGNGYFKSWTEDILTNLSAWRFVYRSDVVPRIIPTQFGYAHAGHLFAIYWYGAEVYYRQTGGGDYGAAPTSWYYANSWTHHFPWTYTWFFKWNIDNDRFWPTAFEMK